MSYPAWMFIGTFALLLLGYPVAFTLAGSALLFATIGYFTGAFDWIFLSVLPERILGILVNDTLIAVPLFVFMGMVLEKSKLSEELLETMGALLSKLRGGLGISVGLVGGLLAASTGIVGATVVTMGLISLPSMLKHGYSPRLATGIICASGTLGQIIPPSIVLIILGDVISSAYQQAQLSQGIFSPETVSVGDLFVGALVPGALLLGAYLVFIGIVTTIRPPAPQGEALGSQEIDFKTLSRVLIPPLVLIVGVLGSILFGVATPTEAASVGAVGAMGLSQLKGRLKWRELRKCAESTTQITSMVFTLLIGASLFSLVFRGFEGDEWVQHILAGLGGSPEATFFTVMAAMFLLGFFLDFIEITFVIVPLIGPVLMNMGFDPLWLGVMIAMNLQTSFLTPPFGFSLFYLRGVAPDSIRTTQIYQGVVPFIVIQLLVLGLLWVWPDLVLWLPKAI